MSTQSAKVALGLDRMNIAQKSTQFDLIQVGMTGNPAFPDPTPKLADLGLRRDAMVTAQTNQALAREALKKATAKVHETSDAYDVGATQLGAYVETQAAGSAAVIQSANMPVKSDNTAKHPMEQVVDLSITMGDEPGSVDIHFHSVRHAKAYPIRFGQNGPDSLTQKDVFVKSKGELHGLVSGQEVWAQVCAKGADGQGQWSQPVRCMVP